MRRTVRSAFFRLGELVLLPDRKDGYDFGIVQEKKADGCYVVSPMGQSQHIIAHSSFLRALMPLWHCVFQPTLSLTMFHEVLADFAMQSVCQPCPFVQSSIIESNKKVLVLGDLHGSFSSLAHNLQDWYEKGMISDDLKFHPDYILVCTGDYADRGPDGVEILYVLMKLKVCNRNQVFLIRGNHEDEEILEKHGFKEEWLSKFGGALAAQSTWRDLMTAFTSMPSAVILGRLIGTLYDCIMLSHGGIETIPNLLGFVIEKHIQCPGDYVITHQINIEYNNGFNWMDFYASEPDSTELTRISGRGQGAIAFSWTAIAQYMSEQQADYDQSRPYTYCLRALFRGHQHLAGGINQLLKEAQAGKSWQKLQNECSYPVGMYGVYTFTSAPDIFPQGYVKNDAYGIISICNDRWMLTPRIRESF